jgi:hypothetical protein
MAAVSYCCKLYFEKKLPPPVLPKKERVESAKRKKMRKAIIKMFKRHRKFGFTKYGRKKFLQACRFIRSYGHPKAEMYDTLASLSVHDMVVLRRMTRKGIDRDSLNWTNTDHLETGRRGLRGLHGRRRKHRGKGRGWRSWSDIP